MAAVLAKFDYSYAYGGKTVSFKIGDKFSLINKANNDWWHVKRCSVSGAIEEIYVPVLYVEEVQEKPSYSTQSLDRKVTNKKASYDKMEILVDHDVPVFGESLHKFVDHDVPVFGESLHKNLRPAPPPPKRPPEKGITFPRNAGTGSTFGVAIPSSEFSENPVIPPIRDTPSPPFVPAKPVTRNNSDKADSIATSPSGPPATKPKRTGSYKKRNSSNSLEDVGETSTFSLSRSMPSGQGSYPVKGKVNRTTSQEPNTTTSVVSNSTFTAVNGTVGDRRTSLVVSPTSPTPKNSLTVVPRSAAIVRPSSTSTVEDEDYTLPDSWKQYRTPDGTPYYYNEKTKQSSWTKPAIPKAKKSIPAGWVKEVNAFGVQLYINQKTKEKWGLGQGEAGKFYFYNTANASQILFELPEILDVPSDTVNGGLANNSSPVHLDTPQPDSEDLSGRPLSTSDFPAVQPHYKKELTPQPVPMVSQKRDHTPQPPSVVTTTATATAATSTSAQNMSYVHQLSNDIGNRHGYLNRKRMFDSNGKKCPNRNWTYHYVILQDGMLSFYKDIKQARETPGARAQSMFSLLYSSVSLPSVPVKRKNVFQISASFGEQFFMQADTPQMMNDWYTSLQASIKKIQSEKGSTDMVDYSPASQRRAHQSLVGSDSDEEVDSEMIDTSSGTERSVRIRSRLRRFIDRRPKAETLRNQGIILDNEFGCDLTKLVESEGGSVPKFLVRCMDEIEKRGLTVTGIYRLSGNVAQIQKLRYRTDQDIAVDFADQEWEDINVISGALKLFLRELPDPLIPFSLYNKFIEAGKQQHVQKITMLKSCVKDLPKANYQTLKSLSNHLRHVMDHSAVNKMQSTNLAIVFGPTVMRSEGDSLAIALLMPIQSRVMEAFLTDYDTIFGGKR